VDADYSVILNGTANKIESEYTTILNGKKVQAAHNGSIAYGAYTFGAVGDCQREHLSAAIATNDGAGHSLHFDTLNGADSGKFKIKDGDTWYFTVKLLAVGNAAAGDYAIWLPWYFAVQNISGIAVILGAIVSAEAVTDYYAGEAIIPSSYSMSLNACQFAINAAEDYIYFQVQNAAITPAPVRWHLALDAHNISMPLEGS
jgi:hypothetical protein